MIGEIFDNVHSEGSTNTVKESVQTTLVPAGGATIVDFKVQYPGKYILVDHALSRAGKGLADVLGVKGREDAKVYRPSHTSAATRRTDWVTSGPSSPPPAAGPPGGSERSRCSLVSSDRHKLADQRRGILIP